jgi:hypothetical protein
MFGVPEILHKILLLQEKITDGDKNLVLKNYQVFQWRVHHFGNPESKTVENKS